MKTLIRELIQLSFEMNTQWTGRGPTPHPNPYARHRDSQTLNPHCVSSIPHPLLKPKKPDSRFGSLRRISFDPYTRNHEPQTVNLEREPHIPGPSPALGQRDW